jgi:hypothetical protein
MDEEIMEIDLRNSIPALVRNLALKIYEKEDPLLKVECIIEMLKTQLIRLDFEQKKIKKFVKDFRKGSEEKS